MTQTPNTTTMHTPGNNHKRDFGMSADSVYFWANWVLVGALIVGVVATYAIVVTGRLRDTALQRDLAAQRTRTAELTRQAGELNLEVAKANERAGLAEQRAAAANLALEQYKAPRSISDSQARIMRTELQHFSGQAADVFKFGTEFETAQFTASIVRVLTSAGWHVRVWEVMSGGAASGLFVLTKPESAVEVERAATALEKALRSAGVSGEKRRYSPEWGDWDSYQGTLYGPTWDKNNVAPIRIAIGAKQ